MKFVRPSPHARIAILALSLQSIAVINSVPDEPLKDGKRFRSIPKALNYLHSCLPDDMPLEEKCKRYAVLLSMPSTNGIPYGASVISLAAQDAVSLNEYYWSIDAIRLGAYYMSAIDGYRISKLAPPFIDLVECLRRMNSRESREYLGNQELNIVIDLYKQVLGISNATIRYDINTILQRELRSGFREMLRVLFSDHPVIGKQSNENVMSQYQRRRRIRANLAGSSSSLAGTESGRRRHSIRQQQYRERNLLRERERSLYKHYRMKILDPEALRKRDRTRKQRSRDRLRQLPEQIAIADATHRQPDSPTGLQDKILPEEPLSQGQLSDSSGSDRPINISVQEQMQEDHLGQPRLASFAPRLQAMPMHESSPPALPLVLSPSIIVPDHWVPIADGMLVPGAQHTTCNHSQLSKDHAISTMLQSFEPESQEERRAHQDLIDCATQPNETEAVLRIISRDLQSNHEHGRN